MLLDYKEKLDPAQQQAAEVKTRPRQKLGVAVSDDGLAKWVGTVSVVIVLVLTLSVWSARGQNAIPQSPSAVQHSSVVLIHSSVVLIDEIEHLPALAWKAIPISLPHGGIVNIDLRVVRGNPIDVFLTTPDQIDNVKKVGWNNLKVYEDIKAAGTKNFSREVWLRQGGFYLIVRDMTVMAPSSPPSDISVKVRLNP